MLFGNWTRASGLKDRARRGSISDCQEDNHGVNPATSVTAPFAKASAHFLLRNPFSYGFSGTVNQASGKHNILGDNIGDRDGGNAGNNADDNGANDGDQSPTGNGGGGSHNGNSGHPKRPIGSLWACPFFRLDPNRHAKCGTYTLNRFSDVKQHLIRCHSANNYYYCKNCWRTWKSANPWNVHMNQNNCQLGTHRATEDSSRMERFLQHETELLQQPQFLADLNDYQKWYKVWGTFFREFESPVSPYIEDLNTETHASYRSRVNRALMDQLSTIMRKLNIPAGESKIRSLKDEMLRACFDEPVSEARRFRVPTQAYDPSDHVGPSLSPHISTACPSDVTSSATRDPVTDSNYCSTTLHIGVVPPPDSLFAGGILMPPYIESVTAGALRAQKPATELSRIVNEAPNPNIALVYYGDPPPIDSGIQGPSNEIIPPPGGTPDFLLDLSGTVDPNALSLSPDNQVAETSSTGPGATNIEQNLDQDHWRY